MQNGTVALADLVGRAALLESAPELVLVERAVAVGVEVGAIRIRVTRVVVHLAVAATHRSGDIGAGLRARPTRAGLPRRRTASVVAEIAELVRAARDPAARMAAAVDAVASHPPLARGERDKSYGDEGSHRRRHGNHDTSLGAARVSVQEGERGA